MKLRNPTLILGYFVLGLLTVAFPAKSSAAGTDALTEVIDNQTDAGGIFEEVDATPEEAAEIARGDETDLSPAARKRVEEIVVSARKRDELLEETPVSVTALDANTLAEAGVTNLRDVRTLVPNLQFEESPVPVMNSSNLRIRGIGTAAVGTAFDPGVGVYVDGIYIPRNLQGILDVVDVAQIEVLRGPQGTLFGKNTVGGALNITTQKPLDEVEAFASVRVGNFDSVQTRAMLNTPITDWLAARISFASKNSGGWVEVENPENNSKDLFNQNSLAFLGSLRFTPSENLTIDVSGNWARNHSRGQANTCLVQPGASPAFANAEFLADPGGACVGTGPRLSTEDAAQRYDNRSAAAWASLNWDIGEIGVFDELSLTASTSWRSSFVENVADIDGTYLPILLVRLEESDDPESGAPIAGNNYSGEVQLNFATWENRINGVIGVFGFYEDVRLPANIVNTPLPGILTQSVFNDSHVKNRDLAGYGQASIDLLEWLELTVGLRWTQERKATDLDKTTIRNGTIDPLSSGSADKAITFTKWTPMASLAATMPDHLLDDTTVDHLMGYFTYSEGFRGGGFNSIPAGPPALDPFNPETLDSFEVGVKSAAFDHRISANFSAFLYKYDNKQVVTASSVCTDPEDITTCSTSQIVTNAAQATGKGIELELLGRPVDGLFITGSVGLLDAAYDSFPDTPPALAASTSPNDTVNRAGQSFTNAPELQTHISIMTALPISGTGISWLDGYLVPRLDWYYQSKVHFSEVEVTAANQPGYNLLHARLSYSFMDDAAQVTLFGNNLTDEEYLSFAQNVAPFFGSLSAVYGQPRTFGGEISYRFN